jgi:rhodanese-related sulfurtransferase
VKPIWKRFGKDIGTVLILPMTMIGLATSVSGCRTQPTVKYAIPHPRLSLAEFQSYVALHQVPILDARDHQSYDEGHVPGAINLAPGDFANEYEKLKKVLVPHQKGLVIVYCGDQWCGLADELQMKLIALDFQHVARFPGGWVEWQQAKLPEVKIDEPMKKQ